MRKLSSITVFGSDILALDENGETWYGQLERLKDESGAHTEDRMIRWQPLKNPPDGAHYSERKLSFWDQVEREGRENIEHDKRREATLLAKTKPIDTGRTVQAVQFTPDHSIEDGEGTDPSQ